MDEENEACFPTLKLPLLHISTDSMSSPDRPSTPPLPSIPFRWEKEPGKPRSITPRPKPDKCLELPPCSRITKTPSPTTVLDAPKFSSFRMLTTVRDRQDSFGSYYSPERELFGVHKTRGFFGKFKGGKKVVDGGSCRFSPSSSSYISCCDSYQSSARFSTTAKPSHFLASIYQGLKQVMHWKGGRKSKKQGND